MKLSVIIVNYNVKHFLEQCLHAVQKASEGFSVETIVLTTTCRWVCTCREKFRDKIME